VYKNAMLIERQHPVRREEKTVFSKI